MTKALLVRICFCEFWLSGDGRGLGSEADARALRDDDGWPAMPMSQIKGILRETSQSMEDQGAVPKGRTTELFGANEHHAALAFDGLAVVPPWARNTNDPAGLFHVVSSTAHTSLGAAKDHTLRAIEAVAPTEIVGFVMPTYGGDGPDKWQEDLALICQWTRSFGKDKGNFGAATATCHVLENSPKGMTSSTADIPEKPSTLWITLVGTGDIRFTDRPSTEGLRRTLGYIPGSALLGAAARRYTSFGAEAHSVFHLGGVRFGPALQTEEGGGETIPAPASYAMPKGRKGEAWRNRTLAFDLVVDGRPQNNSGGEQTQYEPIKSRFMTAGLAQVQTETTTRTRTATRGGLAAQGQLFTTEYLRTAGRTFQARVDVDRELSEHARKLLEKTLSGELRLGSARSNSGGIFQSDVAWTAQDKPEAITLESGKVRVLCVSDVCILDTNGAPSLTIPATKLGLCGAKLNSEACVVSHRRYTKRNGHFNAMTDERLVIEAGSVFEYELPEDVVVMPRQVIGRHQQDGLGVVWIAPRFLGAEIAPEISEPAPTRLECRAPGSHIPDEKPSNTVVPSTPTRGYGGVRVYDITLRTTAPLITASGRSLTLDREAIGNTNDEKESATTKRETITVDELLRGPDGLPTIAPRSIRGALRAIARRRFEPREVKRFMGFVDGNDGKPAGFKITWPKVILGKGRCHEAIENLLRSDTPLLRDRVAINAAGVVDDRKKFTVNAVPKGTIFSFQIVTPLIATQDGTLSADPMMERLIRLLRDPEFRLGGSTTAGFGAVAAAVACHDLSWTDGRLSNDSAPSSVGSEDSEEPTTTILGPYNLKASHFLSIAGGAAAASLVPEGIQSVPTSALTTSAQPNSNVLGLLRETVISWDGDTPTLTTEFPLPGSALKGVLAHRALYHWNLHEAPLDWTDPAAKERFAKLATRPAALTWLFGEAKDDESGRQGGLFVEEVTLNADHVTRIDHVSIDRFTSGARDQTGALYAEEVLFEPTFELTLQLRPPDDVDAQDWNKATECLNAAIFDLREGRLAVGGRGHGFLETIPRSDGREASHV